MGLLPSANFSHKSMSVHIQRDRIQDTGVNERAYVILGLVNYFRDHIRNNSTHDHHLHDMVSAVNKKIVKVVTWTSADKAAFKTRKELVNACPKLYFIKNEYKIILYTDASDYAHGRLPLSSNSSVGGKSGV